MGFFSLFLIYKSKIKINNSAKKIALNFNLFLFSGLLFPKFNLFEKFLDTMPEIQIYMLAKNLLIFIIFPTIEYNIQVKINALKFNFLAELLKFYFWFCFTKNKKKTNRGTTYILKFYLIGIILDIMLLILIIYSYFFLHNPKS